MACNPLITDPFTFPRRPSNRPGLPRIAYRIGRYADFVEAIKRGIDAAPELAAWTHRDPDDPGIALVEGAAILGDILSFYQEHYANEAYLRTAAWRESVAELVRLTGYRLAPGIGGRATFAFEVKRRRPGDDPRRLPGESRSRGRAVAGGLPDRSRSCSPTRIWSRFNLYRARSYAGVIAVERHARRARERGRRSRRREPRGFRAQARRQVDAGPERGNVERFPARRTRHSRRRKSSTLPRSRAASTASLIDLDKPVITAWNSPVTAYRLGRTFRHFGHNAPASLISNIVDNTGKITGTSTTATQVRALSLLHAVHLRF